MLQSLKILLPVVIVIGLSGCSYLFGNDGYFRDRGSDYLEAETIPPIQIPKELDKSSLEQLFVIPPIEAGEAVLTSEFKVPRPDRVAINRHEDNIRIQKLGNRRWVVIDSPPEKVWPRVLQFLADSNIGISMKNPIKGMIETTWLPYQDDEVTKNKYRIFIEHSLQHGTSEIHVRHVMVPRSVSGGGHLTWPNVSVNPERETWLIDELVGQLVQDERTSVSFLAQAIDSEVKSKLIVADGSVPTIEIKLDYARAWASLGLALDRGGFDVNDKDRENGTYYVSHSDKDDDDQEPGFFSRLLGGKQVKEETQEQLRAKSQFKITATQQENDVVVVSLVALGESDDWDSDKLSELVATIKENLS